MQRALLLVLVSGLGAAMCEKNIARPPVEEVPIRELAQEDAPPDAGAAAKPGAAKDRPTPPDRPPASDASLKPDPAGGLGAGLALSPAIKDDSPEPPRDRAFPKQADACKKDDDCAASSYALGGEAMCCIICRPVAGTRAWVRRVEQVCQQKVKSAAKSRCAPSDCPKPEVECRAGKCSVR